MTKKDYVKIAAVMKSNKPCTDHFNTSDEIRQATVQWQNIVMDTASMLQDDSPSFNKGLFYKACNFNGQLEE